MKRNVYLDEHFVNGQPDRGPSNPPSHSWGNFYFAATMKTRPSLFVYLCICICVFVYLHLYLKEQKNLHLDISSSQPPTSPQPLPSSSLQSFNSLYMDLWIKYYIYSTQLQDFLNSGQINFRSILRVLLERCRDKWNPMKKRLEKLLRKLWSKITLFLIWSDWRLRAPCGGERWWCLLYRFCIRSTLLKCITRLKIVYHHLFLFKLLYYY